MLVIFVKVANAPNALRLVLILAAVSLMTVPAGISPVNADTCAAVSGAGAVAALATVNAAADTLTVLLLLVVMVGAVVVLATVVLVTAVVGADTVCVVLLIVEILTITAPKQCWLCLS